MQKKNYWCDEYKTIKFIMYTIFTVYRWYSYDLFMKVLAILYDIMYRIWYAID